MDFHSASKERHRKEKAMLLRSHSTFPQVQTLTVRYLLRGLLDYFFCTESKGESGGSKDCSRRMHNNHAA